MTTSEKENRQAIILDYISSHPDASLRELGELLGVSRQRVHVLLRGLDLDNAKFERHERLTQHQLDILKHVGKGLVDRQIGELMGCSAQSIRNQLQVIYAKLNVHDRRDAVQLALKKGYLTEGVLNL